MQGRIIGSTTLVASWVFAFDSKINEKFASVETFLVTSRERPFRLASAFFSKPVVKDTSKRLKNTARKKRNKDFNDVVTVLLQTRSFLFTVALCDRCRYKTDTVEFAKNCPHKKGKQETGHSPVAPNDYRTTRRNWRPCASRL